MHPCTLLKQQREKHSTHQTRRLRLVVLFLSSVVVGDRQKAWQMLFRTGPRPRSSRLGQYWQKIFVDVFKKYKKKNKKKNKWPGNNGLSNNPQNNPFLPGYSSSPGWLLVTRTRGAWWCRYRGHWRSGPRHLSPRSRVCAQEWHPKDIHSHIHSHPPMRAPKANEEQNPQLTKHDCFLYLSSSCPMRWGSTARTTAWQTLLGTAPRRRPSRLGQYWQKTFVDVFNTYS